ncbi:MAG TPA: FKBP-type peptidyl-prolyl cis-trans isomerase [Chryseolinea sp.]
MKKNMKRVGWVALVLVGASLGLYSCIGSGDNYNAGAQLEADVTAIDNFLDANFLDAVKDPSGIRMVITQLGNGLPAASSDSVDVDYVGTVFSSGAQFDAGNTKGVVAGYIDGWKVALTTLPSGSQATIYVPSPYGYGNVDKASIPANSILVFKIRFNRVMITQAQITQFKKDTTAITTYLQGKGITPVIDPSGLRYVVTEPGAGQIPSWYNRAKIHYDVKLLSDDSRVVASVDQTTDDAAFRVVDNIHALQIGLQRVHVGGKITLYAPSGYAWGPAGASVGGGIAVPTNSPVIIELQLQGIVSQ